ncbi:alcohol dehydrogenase catalytic domain-containing protein [Actinomadura sp. KC216]|uniref:zinc-dependent alcohol dehydrogenase n=1 Tax=Actinomadura sp. KC216 TaxID=2530370 RepID=UPI00140484B5|nr:alcohol dehydrogenase catalytic domain-containing protein [Actinomadura sp. KC216]
MRALVYVAPTELVVGEVAEPEPGEGDVVLTVELVGLGGSEVLALRDPGARTLPLIMGHGVVGRTPEGRRVAVNPLSGCGDCARCTAGVPQRCAGWRMLGVHHDGGLAERVAVARQALVEIPDGLTWEQAVFIEPFANAVRAWERSGATGGDAVGVIGAGGLGLGCVAAARQAGAELIDCFEPSEERALAAKGLGATGRGPVRGRRYDVVFDSVGSAATRALAIEHTRPGGHIVLLGFADTVAGFDPVAFIRAEHRLTGSFVFDDAQFRVAIGLAGRTDPAWVRAFGLDTAAAALEGFARGDHSIVKAAVRPADLPGTCSARGEHVVGTDARSPS